MSLPFANAFYELVTRWICKIKRYGKRSVLAVLKKTNLAHMIWTKLSHRRCLLYHVHFPSTTHEKYILRAFVSDAQGKTKAPHLHHGSVLFDLFWGDRVILTRIWLRGGDSSQSWAPLGVVSQGRVFRQVFSSAQENNTPFPPPPRVHQAALHKTTNQKKQTAF